MGIILTNKYNTKFCIFYQNYQRCFLFTKCNHNKSVTFLSTLTSTPCSDPSPSRVYQSPITLNSSLKLCMKRFCTQTLAKSVGKLPSEAYTSLVDQGSLQPDDYQIHVMKKFDEIQKKLQNYEPPKKSMLGKWLGGLFGSLSDSSAGSKTKSKIDTKIPKGLYIYGAVGGGKTMLMDLFHEVSPVVKKKRVHFHAFMSDVHSRIHQVKQATAFDVKSGTKPMVYDPIPPVADQITEEAWLLCFDEFQVTDIGDAMVLKRLFTTLFKNGVVVIATSNRPPDDLYKNGLQRSNFVPFIQILKDHCDIISLDSGVDYRQRRLPGQKDKVFFVKSECDANNELNRIFKFLCSKENDTVRPKVLTIKGRNVTLQKTCGQVLDCTFEEICDRPLGATDYLRMSQFFHTILIRDIPQLNLKLKSQARRFITLVDTLYDNRVRIVISSDVPFKELFGDPDENKDDLHSHEDRVLMDDLGIKAGTEGSKASIFTGEEEIFAFERTMSRLAEMQSKEYWEAWEKHR